MGKDDTAKTTYIFLHNFRCTGNALNLALRNYFMHDHVKLGVVNEKVYSHDEIVKQARARQPQFILGHNVFGLHRRFDFPCRYFVNLRDPVERLISGFVTWSKVQGQSLHDYYQTHEEQSNGMTYRLLGFGKRDQNLVDFNSDKAITAYPDLNETLFQQAKDNLDEYVDVILLSELFTESVANMEHRLQLPALVCPQGIYFNQSKTFINAKHFPLREIDQLRENNRWDYELYQYAKTKLQAQLAQHDSTFWEAVRIRQLLTAMMKEPGVDVVDGTQVVTKLQNGLNTLLYLGMGKDLVPVISLFINSISIDIHAARQIVKALTNILAPNEMEKLSTALLVKEQQLRLAS